MTLIYYESSKAAILRIAFGCGSQANALCQGEGEPNIAMNQRSFRLQAIVLDLHEPEDRNGQISGYPSLTCMGNAPYS